MPNGPAAPTGLSTPAHKRRAGTTFLQVLPRRIVKYRELRAVSQSALAKAAEISRSTLNTIEGGQAVDMKVSTLERLCHALGVSADALLGYNAVKLVRLPALHGLNKGGPRPFGSPRTCEVCGVAVAARALHLPGDCILELSDKGATGARIGAVFGLSTKTIEGVLREEHAIRRHRRS